MAKMRFEIIDIIEDKHVYAQLTDGDPFSKGVAGLERIGAALVEKTDDTMVWDVRGTSGEMLTEEFRKKLEEYFPNKKIFICSGWIYETRERRVL